MKKWSLFFLFAALLCYLTFAPGRLQRTISKESHDQKTLHVLSTTGMIGDLVAGIGQEKVTSSVLIHGQLDPHNYQLVKGDVEKFSHADLIFYNGLGLEHAGSLVHLLQESAKAIGVGDQIGELVPEKILWTKGLPDPHIWMDVSLWMEASFVVESALSAASPEEANYFHKNGSALRERLAKLDQTIFQTIAFIPVEKRFVITSHDAFSYFVRRYFCQSIEGTDEGVSSWRERFKAPAGLAPDGQLNFHDIEKIVDYLEKRGASTLFPESNVAQDALKKIVQCGREKGLKIKIAKEVLYGDAMGPYHYEEMMEHNANTLRNHLQ